MCLACFLGRAHHVSFSFPVEVWRLRKRPMSLENFGELAADDSIIISVSVSSWNLLSAGESPSFDHRMLSKQRWFAIQDHTLWLVCSMLLLWKLSLFFSSYQTVKSRSRFYTLSHFELLLMKCMKFHIKAKEGYPCSLLAQAASASSSQDQWVEPSQVSNHTVTQHS